MDQSQDAEGRGAVLKNLALLLASVVLALGLAEATMRLFPSLLPEEVQLRVQWGAVDRSDPTSVRDPYIGFLYPPNHRGERRHGDVDFTYTTDAKGFRNPGPWPEHADIVVLGDSWVFGYGVDDAASWTRLLDERLPGTEVLNLGLIGAAPQQYVRIFERFGAPLAPDLVLLGLFPGNDLLDGRTFHEWLEAGSPGNYDVWRFFRGDPDPGGWGVRQVAQKSYLVTLLRVTVKSVQHSFSGTTLTLDDGTDLRLAPGVLASSAGMADPDHPAFRRVMNTMARARRLARQNGARLVVLLFPAKEEVYLPLTERDVPELVPVFRDALERREIPYLDLTPRFREVARKGVALYHEVDGHPNAAGYRLIADIITDSLSIDGDRYELRTTGGSVTHPAQ